MWLFKSPDVVGLPPVLAPLVKGRPFMIRGTATSEETILASMRFIWFGIASLYESLVLGRYCCI